MTSWQINIYCDLYSESVDMDAVRTACADLIDGIDQDNEYESDFIRVEAGNVGVAVSRINALGYTTDEDDTDDEA